MVEELVAVFPSTLGDGLRDPPHCLGSLDIIREADVSAERVTREFTDRGRTAEIVG